MTAAREVDRIAYTPSEVALMIGASEDFVRDLCAGGDIEAHKFRSKWFIPADVVERMFGGRGPG